MSRVLAAAVFACGLALPLFARGPALAQQPAPADPAAAISAEWQAMRLAQDHAAEKVNALIQAYQQQQAAYEARLATALAWLKAAQAAGAQQ